MAGWAAPEWVQPQRYQIEDGKQDDQYEKEPHNLKCRRMEYMSSFRRERASSAGRRGRGPETGRPGRTRQAPGLVPRCRADGYEGGADAGCDTGVPAEAEADPDEGGVDEGGAADDDVLAAADDVDDVEDVVGVVGVAVWCTVGDE